MATETNESVTAEVLARIKKMHQFRNLIPLVKSALTLKLTKTNGDLYEAIAILQPGETKGANESLAREILAHPDVAFIEHIAGCTFEELTRADALKQGKS